MAAFFGNSGTDHGNGEPSALKKLLLQFDKEGGVGRLEIEMFLNELGNYPTDEELNAKIDKYDGDDNGILELNEFMMFLLNELQINDTEEEIIEAFKVFDKDGNGFIDAAEIRRVMTNLGDKLSDDEVDIMIRKSDLDGDGQVNYEEFVKIIMAKIRAQEHLTHR
ncbi:uncharacterized protein LOC130657172 isoform X2 [Hydractinia symbiolongicarpus]|uniref:uncharacterized protein LOC130657172 isoform X2 n=1 Tax=Hydractinia symbiolongicarpus TaxID=13093 RepID=UPI00254A4E95|nr:uncharacterized protein LOC130657172 isoform X2 [Hydractinia symbiolongicarpus]